MRVGCMRINACPSIGKSWGLDIRHQPGLHSETSFKRQKQESCDLRQELIPGQAERSPDARHGWNSCGCYTVALAGKWEPRGGSSTESKGRNTWPRREAKCGAEEIGDSTWGGRRSKCGDVDGTRTGREQAACSAVHQGSKVGQSTPALTESLGKQSNRVWLWQTPPWKHTEGHHQERSMEDVTWLCTRGNLGASLTKN